MKQQSFCILIRSWHNGQCGEVIGRFAGDTPSSFITVNVLLSQQDDWTATRGTLNKKPKCAHSDSENYLPVIHLTNLDRLISDDVMVLKSTNSNRLAALTFAVMNIASIWTNQPLDENVSEVWESDRFAQAQDTIGRKRGHYKPNLIPRIVIVSKEEEETVGGDQ